MSAFFGSDQILFPLDPDDESMSQADARQWMAAAGAGAGSQAGANHRYTRRASKSQLTIWVPDRTLSSTDGRPSGWNLRKRNKND